jgi:xanthine/uracil permease
MSRNAFIYCFLLAPVIASASNVTEDQRLPSFAGLLIFAGAFIVVIAFLVAIAKHSLVHENWVPAIVKEHFAATVGLPLAAIAALCIVLLLGFSEGPIEFSA